MSERIRPSYVEPERTLNLMANGNSKPQARRIPYCSERSVTNPADLLSELTPIPSLVGGESEVPIDNPINMPCKDASGQLWQGINAPVTWTGEFPVCKWAGATTSSFRAVD